MKGILILAFIGAFISTAIAVITTTLPCSADLSLNPYSSTATDQQLGQYRGTRFPLLKFDLSGLPQGLYVTSATLNVTWAAYNYDYPAAIRVYSMFVQDVQTEFTEDATWTSSGVTSWAADGMKDGVDRNTVLNREMLLNLLTTNKDVKWTTVDVHEAVQYSFDNNRNWVGFTMTSELYSASVYSRESTSPPTLTLTYATDVPRSKLPTMTIKNSDEWSPGGTIALSSSQSTIPEGTTPVYTWSLIEGPPGTYYEKDEVLGTDVNLDFVADTYGFYHIKLRIAKSDDPDAFSEAETYVKAGIKTQRPRVHISRDYWQNTLKGADLSQMPWSKMVTLANENGYWNYVAYQAVYTYFLLYMNTGDTKWCTMAWDNAMKNVIFVNGDSNQGYQTIMGLANNDPHEAAFFWGQQIGTIAVALDWGYDCLSDFQKNSIIEWVHREAENVQSNTYHAMYLRNDGIVILSAISRAFASLYGSDPNTDRLAELYVKGWKKLREVWSVLGKGGGSGEGNGYGTQTLTYLMLGAHAMWTATGEDTYEYLSLFRERLMYDTFAVWPARFGEPWQPIYFNYPAWEISGIGGDGRRSVGVAQLNLRPLSLGLLARYRDTEEGRAHMFLMKSEPIEWDLHELIFPLERQDPYPEPTKLSHYAEGLGYVYIRSDWTSEATWFALWAGPHVDLHQHLDKGAFNIYKRRDLAIKSGNYDYASALASHSIAYYTRTVSANGILVIDPLEQPSMFIGGRSCFKDPESGASYTILLPNGLCPPNDGGQRTASPLPLSVDSVDFWENNYYLYDMAKITSFYDFDGVVSIAADLTNAYNNEKFYTTANRPKVKEVYRKTIYIRELDLFLIGDVVTATDASFVKKTLLHALQSIDINTDGNTVIENVRPGIDWYRNVKSGKIRVDDSEPSNYNQVTYDLRNGTSHLLFETVFPAQFSYRLVGGRTPQDGPIADFWNDDYSEALNTADQPRVSKNYPVESAPEAVGWVYFNSTYIGGYGRYRLEVVAETNQATDYFLNIYRPTIDGINNNIPSYSTFEDSETFGVTLTENGKDYVVQFPKNGDAPFVGDAPPNIPAAGPSSGPRPPRPPPKTPSAKTTISSASQLTVTLVTIIVSLLAL